MQQLITVRFDAGNALQHPLKERETVARQWLQNRLHAGIVNREPFAHPRQGVILETGKMFRVELWRHFDQLFDLEILQKHGTAAVRGAANQPAIQQPVAVHAVFGREHGLVRQELQHQGRAERRDAVPGLGGPGGQKGSNAVGGAGQHMRVRTQSEIFCHLRADGADVVAGFMHFREQIQIQSQRTHPVRPAQVFRVIAELQAIVVIADAEAASEHAGYPVSRVQGMRGLAVQLLAL